MDQMSSVHEIVLRMQVITWNLDESSRCAFDLVAAHAVSNLGFSKG